MINQTLAWVLTGAYALVMARLMLKWSSEEWYYNRSDAIHRARTSLAHGRSNITELCNEFHRLQAQPRPYYVRVHEWLSRRAV